MQCCAAGAASDRISANFFGHTKHSQRNEFHFPLGLCRDRFARESKPSCRCLEMADFELSEPTQFQGEPVDAQVVQQSLFQSINDCSDRDLCDSRGHVEITRDLIQGRGFSAPKAGLTSLRREQHGESDVRFDWNSDWTTCFTSPARRLHQPPASFSLRRTGW